MLSTIGRYKSKKSKDHLIYSIGNEVAVSMIAGGSSCYYLEDLVLPSVQTFPCCSNYFGTMLQSGFLPAKSRVISPRILVI